MKYDLSTLNEEQQRPVFDIDGALLVTAGAGSGKTRVLTHRIAYLINEKNVPPWNILAITFTNKAANEMKSRLYDMVGEARGLWVSTFHSMCVTILRKFVKNIGYTSNFSIYGESEKERLIKKLLKDAVGDTEKLKNVMGAISSAKNDGVDPDGYIKRHAHSEGAELIHGIFASYEDELKKSNALDFDDLLIKTLFLLVNDTDAREYYQDKFQYIHIDEFQDTNTVQYKLIKILASKHRNIMVVGDEDQSIYGWRGASSMNISDFCNDFNAKIYKLEQNYRSTKRIIERANDLIAYNTARIKKTLWTENDEGEDVKVYAAKNESDEAEYVVKNIYSLMNEYGYEYSDFAVLVRINALTRSFEEKLLQYGIPHCIFGGFKFYERKEVKDLLAYLRIAVNHKDSEAIKRVINFPKRGIGDSSVVQLENYCSVTGNDLYDVIFNIEKNEDLPKPLIKKILPFSAVLLRLFEEMENLTVPEIMRFLVRLLKLKDVYAEENEENENRKENIRQLISSAEEFQTKNAGASLEEYIQSISLYSDTDEIGEKGAVNIATVHSAKGLEFKVVFVAGLEEGIFPSSRAMESLFEAEEERRLMYVAITRAEERLYLTYSASRFLYNERKYTVPSKFFSELNFEVAASLRQYNNNNSSSGYSYQKQGTGAQNYLQQKSSSPYQAPAAKIDVSSYKEGMKVLHHKFGEGRILNITRENENSYAEIDFSLGGKLILALAYAPLKIVN